MERLTRRNDVIGYGYPDCEKCQSKDVCNGSSTCLTVLATRLAAYEDTGLEPEEIKKQIGWLSPVCFGCEGRKPDFSRSEKCGYERDEFRLCLERSKHLVDLVKAEQQGRLVVLPCKVGDTIYRPSRERDEVWDWEVTEVHILSDYYGEPISFVDDSDNEFFASDIGKTVFLTRSEAEKAMEGENT